MNLTPSYTLYATSQLTGYSEVWLRKLCRKLSVGHMEGRQLRFTEADISTLLAYKGRRQNGAETL